MTHFTNKIDANDRTIADILDGKKYAVDYFQREFSWEQSHIEQLITDLTSAFLDEYTEGDTRTAGTEYNSYYLGPLVFIERDGGRSVIDGQQRLTSLTLFLIYLNHLQRELKFDERLEPMIYSDHRGVKSFNLDVPERERCLEQLFSSGTYEPIDADDESTVNMARRYEDIGQAFPEELRNETLPYFLDWLRHNVVLVEIIAYSEENAYTIFETMNDRGLNLTSTEMLKGYILSNIHDPILRHETNVKWKEAVQKLHKWSKDEDQSFFQSWLRSQYADTIRSGLAGSQNEDFEKIGTRFHTWVPDNLDKLRLDNGLPQDLKQFLDDDFSFFLNAYFKIMEAQNTLTSGLEHIYYIHRWGIASSLSFPLMLAPLTVDDDEETVDVKLNLVARYIETFAVRRSVNYHRFAASSIRYTMYTLVKDIRGKTVSELKAILRDRLHDMSEEWCGMDSFGMHGQNKRFVKFLLARITAFIEKESGFSTSFATYYDEIDGKPFEIEHIWADSFADHLEEFDQRDEFHKFRNMVGGLLLIQQGRNQSLGSMGYEEKRSHYATENLLAKSLCSITYKNNPNFTNMHNRLALDFQPHDEFRKSDLVQRQRLYRNVAETIWSTEI